MLPTIVIVIEWLKANETLIITILTLILALEQYLASTEKFKASSTFQLIFNFTNGLVKFLKVLRPTLQSSKQLSVAEKMQAVIKAVREKRGPETPPQLQEQTDAEIANKMLKTSNESAFDKLNGN